MRDYTGIPFSLVEDALVRRSLSTIDYYLRDSSRGFARIQNGEIPDGSGTPLSSVIDLTDYMFLPGRPGGQTVRGIQNDTSPTVTLNTAAAGTSALGSSGTAMLRLTFGSTTLADFAPVQFGVNTFDAAIRPTAGFQVISVDGTAGMRFVPTSNRAFIQAGILNAGGSVLNADMTIGGLGATYGSTIGINFASVYFEGATNTAAHIGAGVAGGNKPMSPSAFGANWKGVLGLAGVSATETAIRLVPFSDTTGAPLLEVMGAVSSSSPTQIYGSKLFSIEHDQLGSNPTSRTRLNLYGNSASQAGFLSVVGSPVSGYKMAFYDRNSNIALTLDSSTGFWADTKNVTFLDVGQSVSSFKAASIHGVDVSVLDRFHIASLATLLGNAALSGATVVPGAMWHIRNTANAAQVLTRLQPHGSQSVDIFQIRNSSDGASLSGFTSAGAPYLIAGAGTGKVLTSDAGGIGSWSDLFSGPQTITDEWYFQGNGSTRALKVDSSANGISIDDGLGLGIVSSSGFTAKLAASDSLAADILLTLPTASGALIGNLETVSISNKALTTGTSIRVGGSAADTNGVQLRRTTSTTVGFRINAAAATTNFKDLLLQNLDGTVPIVGNDPPAVASGALGKVDSTAVSGAVGATNLTNGPPSGDYLVTYYLQVTTADITAGTIQFQIGFTDTIGATTRTGTAIVLTATGRDSGSFVVKRVSGEISYQTNLTGIAGTSLYALDVRVVALG